MVKRMLVMLAVMLVVIGALAFVKFRQIQSAIAQGAAFQPPPEAVTTIVATEEQWPAIRPRRRRPRRARHSSGACATGGSGGATRTGATELHEAERVAERACHPALKGETGQGYRGVRQQFVKLGAARGDQVAILTGIKPGEEIVTSGVFKLRNGAAVHVDNKVQPANKRAPKPEDS